MTLTQVLTMSLRRAGLSTSSTGTYWNIARDYFNIGMQDVVTRGNWTWLRTKVSSDLTLTASQAANELASDVAYPLDFWDKTNNKKIYPLPENRVQDFDPDEDDTGEVVYWSNTGIGSNGHVEVTWTPTPDATDRIYYTYRAKPAEKTSSNDSTDLLPTMPLEVQHALVYFIAGTYKGEKGDLEGERQDLSEFEKRIMQSLAINDKQTGHGRHRMTKRRGHRGTGAEFHTLRAYSLTEGYE
jgi:hypothetical protein